VCLGLLVVVAPCHCLAFFTHAPPVLHRLSLPPTAPRPLPFDIVRPRPLPLPFDVAFSFAIEVGIHLPLLSNLFWIVETILTIGYHLLLVFYSLI
jgi:hypothetical protein